MKKLFQLYVFGVKTKNLYLQLFFTVIALLIGTKYVSAKCQNDIDSIRITYFYYNGGYGGYCSTACYAYHKKDYRLLLEKSYNVQNASQLPKTVSKESVSKLLNDCNLYSSEDSCDFIKITKDDYTSYMKIINDKDSLDYYLIFLNIEKEKYELEEDAFLSLSGREIVNIIESPPPSENTLYFNIEYKPLMRIELISNNAGSITIEPLWHFDGTVWKVLSQGKERYVGNEYVMAFLKDIRYDKYAYFGEKFYLLFKIADDIKEKRAWAQKMEGLRKFSQ